MAVVWVAIGAAAVWLIARGLDTSTQPTSSTTTIAVTTTSTTTTTTATAAAVPAHGERPADALADGAEDAVRDVPGFERIDLDIVDVVVVAAIVAIAVWLLWPRRAQARAVSVTVVDGSGDGTETGRSPTSPRPNADAIAALVRDRLNRVDLRPPSSVPSAEQDVGSVIDVVESVDAGKPVGAFARALVRLNPRRSLGFQARLILRRSDTTRRAGITVELDDLDGRTNVSISTVWRDTFEDAARAAAFQLAAVLLRRLPRRARKRIWWRWDESGASLQAYEDANWAIRMRRYDAAIRHLDAGLEQDPSNLALRLRLGQTYERVLMYEDALWTYQPVLDTRTPLDRRELRTREAGLIRWRAAVVLSNAEAWIDAWADRLVGRSTVPPSDQGEAQHETGRRLRALFDERYGTALRKEFRTVRETFLVGRDARTRDLREQTTGRLPQLRLHRLRLVARLTGDRPASTLGILWRRTKGEDPRASEGDERLLQVHRRVDEDLGRRGAEATKELRRAAPAVSLVHFAWRAAEVEVCELSARRRRRAGLSSADIMAFHLGMDRRRLAGIARSRNEQERLVGIGRLLDRRIGEQRLLARLGSARAREARPQAEYNAACASALDIDRPPTDQDGWRAWRRSNDDAVSRVVGLLTRACRGDHNMVERGGADWIVFEDPDLERIRRHPRFCRFAKSVLHREIVSGPTAPPDICDRYLHAIERRSIEIGLAVWRQAIDQHASTPAVAALAECDAALHQRLAALCRAPSSHQCRDAVDLAIVALDPTANGLPEWPRPAAQRNAPILRRRDALGVRHDLAGNESIAAAALLRLDLDRNDVGLPHDHIERRRRTDEVCRSRLLAWQQVEMRVTAFSQVAETAATVPAGGRTNRG
jgi:hypothetical protein